MSEQITGAPEPAREGATVTRFLGVDLAWGEGAAGKPAKETGLAALDGAGTVLDAGWARGIDEVADWIVETATPGTIVAVDAPLVIPNATGMRLAEKQVSRGYLRWKVAANASNQAMRWQGGVSLRRRLEASGFRYTAGTTPPSGEAPTMFECYPYTTMVGMSELGYERERPRYKRLDRTIPVAEARERRAVACDDLIERMSRLSLADPPLDLSSHPVSADLLHTPSPVSDVPYKHREDLLDALLCAWTAAIWHRHGDLRVQVLGRDDEPDDAGRVATIVAPARPEQRVAERPPPGGLQR